MNIVSFLLGMVFGIIILVIIASVLQYKQETKEAIIREKIMKELNTKKTTKKGE